MSERDDILDPSSGGAPRRESLKPCIDLRYLAYATALSSLALAIAHGWRIIENFHETQWEDRGFFQYNRENIHTLSACFLQRGNWPGLYRPLSTNLYYFLGSMLFSDRIEVYHSVNLIFVIANAVLLYRVAVFFIGEVWGLVAPTVFVSRIAAVEVVLHSCEFQGLLCSFFSLLAIDLFIQARASGRSWMDWCSIGSFVLALLSKETAVALPGILLLFGWLFDSSILTKSYLRHAVVAVIWAITFRELLSKNQTTGFSYDFSPSNVLRNYAAYFLDFSNLMVLPLDDIIPRRLVGIADGWAAQVLIIALVLFEIAICLKRSRSHWLNVGAFGLGWFFIATVPFAIFENRLFMRYSYFGHAGLALCVGVLVREFALLGVRAEPSPERISSQSEDSRISGLLVSSTTL